MGGLLAFALVKGFGLVTFGALIAYAAAVVTGVLTGLIAGKPIWARDARIEAGLKAFAGAFLGAAVMFALRRWVGVDVSLGELGQGVVGELPAVSLPLIGVALALVFELDHSVGRESETSEKTKTRVLTDKARVSVDAEAESLEEPVERVRRRKN